MSCWRQIADQRLAAAWRAGSAPALTLYGEADFAAINDRDHRLVLDILNYYRPSRTATSRAVSKKTESGIHTRREC
jgi:hypothetical protein